LFLAVFAGYLACEQDKDSDAQGVPANGPDTNSTLPTTDTLCLDGILYNTECYDESVLAIWGMGASQKEYVSNEKKYTWYIDQADTGPFSENNCGPSSAAMAVNWFDSLLEVKAEDARELYLNDGGWWYTNNITDFLGYHSVPFSIYAFESSEQLADLIKDGNIVILCLTTALIRYNSNLEERTDRFYGYADGHFLIVKGYRYVEQALFFEVYDPNNWHKVYDDGSEKGENRHYRAADITNAVKEWWDYLIVVHPRSDENKIAKEIFKTIEPHTIPQNWGR
jgi:hypothetical protein